MSALSRHIPDVCHLVLTNIHPLQGWNTFGKNTQKLCSLFWVMMWLGAGIFLQCCCFFLFFCNSNMALTQHLYFQILTVITLVHRPTFNITSLQPVNITLSALKLQSLLFNLKLQLRRELRGPDIFHVGGNVPEVDLAIMASCNASIICESYKWCWML